MYNFRGIEKSRREIKRTTSVRRAEAEQTWESGLTRVVSADKGARNIFFR